MKAAAIEHGLPKPAFHPFLCRSGAAHPVLMTILLAWTFLLLPARAQTRPPCAICGEISHKTLFRWPDHARDIQIIVCEDCTKIEARCHACFIWVKRNYRLLDDGRYLCENDAPHAVFDSRVADTIFQEVQRDCYRMFRGFDPIPYRNLKLRLTDIVPAPPQEDLNQGKHTKWLTLGMTRTKRRTDAIEHDIFALEGLSPNRLAAVLAHEFAHAWVNENAAGSRRIDGDTLEGFCELVAYKLVSERNLPLEKLIIERNLYTKGQIQTLIKAETELQFHRLLEWIRNGVDERIEQDSVTAAIRVKPPVEPPAPVYYQTAQPVRPQELTLKAISGSPSKRLALINGTTFAPNEKARVRVGESNIVVRCLEIRPQSVLVELPDGSKKELLLSTGP